MVMSVDDREDAKKELVEMEINTHNILSCWIPSSASLEMVGADDMLVVVVVKVRAKSRFKGVRRMDVRRVDCI